MVKLVPDVDLGRDDAYSGYLRNGQITGFSMLHKSGTGGAPKYGVVSQMPWAGDNRSPKDTFRGYRAGPDEAEVGYYKSSLRSGVTVELAGTDRADMYRYTFARKAKQKSVVVDLSHVLTSHRGMGLEQHYRGGSIEVTDDGRRYMGWYGRYDNVRPSIYSTRSSLKMFPRRRTWTTDRSRDGTELLRGLSTSAVTSTLITRHNTRPSWGNGTRQAIKPSRNHE